MTQTTQILGDVSLIYNLSSRSSGAGSTTSPAWAPAAVAPPRLGSRRPGQRSQPTAWPTPSMDAAVQERTEHPFEASYVAEQEVPERSFFFVDSSAAVADPRSGARRVPHRPPPVTMRGVRSALQVQQVAVVDIVPGPDQSTASSIALWGSLSMRSNRWLQPFTPPLCGGNLTGVHPSISLVPDDYAFLLFSLLLVAIAPAPSLPRCSYSVVATPRAPMSSLLSRFPLCSIL